jgi:hypothetical protein
MADKFIRLNNGKLAETEATDTSTGVAEAGDIVALDSAGKIDVSLLPVGVGPDVAVLPATENLGAGDYVNIFDDGGTPSVRLADASNGRDAHGFVKSAVTASSNATVFFEGANDNLSGLTTGSRYYLDAAGAVTATPPASPASSISQFLGVAISPTAINTDIDDCIELV